MCFWTRQQKYPVIYLLEVAFHVFKRAVVNRRLFFLAVVILLFL